MNEYIQKLSVSCDIPAYEVSVICDKLLAFLNLDRLSEYNATEVEYLMKAALYVEHSFDYFAEELIQKDFTSYQIDRFNEVLSEVKTGTFITNFIGQLLSGDGIKYLAIVEQSLKQVEGEQFLNMLNYEQLEKDKSKEIQMSNLVTHIANKIFNLKPDNIESAVDSMLYKIGFNVLYSIFLPRKSNCLNKKLIALELMICEKIKQSTVPEDFIKSIYYFVSEKEENLEIFYKVLQNRVFSHCLVEYICTFMQKSNDRNKENMILPQIDKCVLHLINICLSCKSSIRFTLLRHFKNSPSLELQTLTECLFNIETELL